MILLGFGGIYAVLVSFLKICTFHKKPRQESLSAKIARKKLRFQQSLEDFEKKLVSKKNCRLFAIIKKKLVKFHEQYLANFQEFIGIDCFLLARNPAVFYSGLIFAVLIYNDFLYYLSGFFAFLTILQVSCKQTPKTCRKPQKQLESREIVAFGGRF